MDAYCRVCMKRSASAILISARKPENPDTEPSLHKQLWEILQCKIEPHDRFSKICDTCATNVTAAYKMKIKLEESHRILTMKLDKPDKDDKVDVLEANDCQKEKEVSSPKDNTPEKTPQRFCRIDIITKTNNEQAEFKASVQIQPQSELKTQTRQRTNGMIKLNAQKLKPRRNL